jgi:hypothetical protein
MRIYQLLGTGDTWAGVKNDQLLVAGRLLPVQLLG